MNINSAENCVIYRIWGCQMARTRINTAVLVPESGVNTSVNTCKYPTGKKLRKYIPAFQRPKVAKTPLFTMSRAFHVFLRLCKYQHFCAAQNAVIYSVVFCVAFKNSSICSVLCISGLKSISIFCLFALFPQKTLNAKMLAFC